MSPWNGAGAPPAAPGVAPRVLRMATSDGWDDEVADRSAVFGALGIVMSPFSDWLEDAGRDVPAPAWVDLQPPQARRASCTACVRTAWRVLDWGAWSSRDSLASALFPPHYDALLGVRHDLRWGGEGKERVGRVAPGSHLFTEAVEKQLRSAAIWLRKHPSSEPLLPARTVIVIESAQQAVLVQTRREAAA